MYRTGTLNVIEGKKITFSTSIVTISMVLKLKLFEIDFYSFQHNSKQCNKNTCQVLKSVCILKIC